MTDEGAVTRIDLRCGVPLQHHIIVATQDDVTFPPIQLTLPNGRVTIRLDVPAELAKEFYSGRRSDKPYWVNTRAKRLRIEIAGYQLNEDDHLRLTGRHPTAEWHTGDGKPYQAAPAFGEHLAGLVVATCNGILRVVKCRYGQFWLEPVALGNSLQHFLFDIAAQWRFPGEAWRTLHVTPPAGTMHVHLGAGDQYLTARDWAAIGDRPIEDQCNPALALLADAKQRWEDDDRTVAVINLNSAIEWCVQRFLAAQLGSSLPERSLKVLLRQAHGRLLEDWVLPLVRQRGIDVETREWPSIKRVQDLRAEAGHPTVGNQIPRLSASDFDHLVRSATSFVARLLAIEPPKTPPFFEAECAGGTVES